MKLVQFACCAKKMIKQQSISFSTVRLYQLLDNLYVKCVEDMYIHLFCQHPESECLLQFVLDGGAMTQIGHLWKSDSVTFLTI